MPVDVPVMIITIFWVLVIFWLGKGVQWAYRSVQVRAGVLFSYRENQAEAAWRRCCFLFPLEEVRPDGAVYKRGGTVCLTLPDKHDRPVAHHGTFVGGNHEALCCVLTDTQALVLPMHEFLQILQNK